MSLHSKIPQISAKVPASANQSKNQPFKAPLPPVQKRPNYLSRRSKSTTDLRKPLSTFNNKETAFIRKPLVKTTSSSDLTRKPLVKTTSTTDPTKKPVKRTGAPLNPPVQPKVSKASPKATKTLKPAPYDYKARFNLLKEQHDKLKAIHSASKEKHTEVLNENETLVSTNKELLLKLENIQQQLSVNEKLLTTFQSENSKLKNENEELHNTLENQTNLIATLKQQVCNLDIAKRKLHNEVQDLKGNIRVFCRVRPSLIQEEHKLLFAINYIDENSIEVEKWKDCSSRHRSSKFEFSFDRVFGPTATQVEIFEELSQLVQSALDGYNVCIFAYGQTGSGKTYTMEGGSSDPEMGMIPRAVDLIFDSFEVLEQFGWKYIVKTSFLEIYNEHIVDLLDPKKNHNQHEIRMLDSTKNDVYVTNLTVQPISCAKELKKYMRIAQRNRAVATTENNERSSRSHSVTKIILEGFNAEQNMKILSSLNLIDLAGSERLHSACSDRVIETKNINKSLANLGNVILALVNKQDHIPYRNSKLTYLLMPCLGGNSKTLMLVNIAPLEDCFNESINSLRFASTVNTCKTGAIKKNRAIQNT